MAPSAPETEPPRDLSLVVQLLIAVAIIALIAGFILANKAPIFGSGEDRPTTVLDGG